MVRLGTSFNIFYNISIVKDRDQGFSLLESLIAIIVLGIIMTGSMAFYGYANALYYRGLHNQIATWVADSEMEVIKNTTSCTNAPTTGNSGNPVSIDKLPGTLWITWPAPATQDPCLANTAKPACSSPTAVGVCVTWREPNELNSRSVSLETYVGS